MTVVEFADAPTLWREAEAFLSRDPANNTQILSSITRLLDRGAHCSERFFAVLDSVPLGVVATVVGAAIRVDSKTLICSAMPTNAARFLGIFLRANDVPLAGVSGRSDLLSAFTKSLDVAYHVHSNRMLYQLTGEPNFGRAPGGLRAVTIADIDLVIEWYRAFEIEAGITAVPAPLEQRVHMSILENTYSFWIHNGTPVAMAGARKLPASSARIGPVYTPPGLRGRGYAQAVTAAASLQVQNDGPRTVFLFTDAANPASNKTYQRIGFRHIADHAHWLFQSTPAR